MESVSALSMEGVTDGGTNDIDPEISLEVLDASLSLLSLSTAFTLPITPTTQVLPPYVSQAVNMPTPASPMRQIKIFRILDNKGEILPVCLCAAPDYYGLEVPQWSIIIPQVNDLLFPDQVVSRIWQRLSYFLPDKPIPPENHFYAKIDCKRYHRTEFEGSPDEVKFYWSPSHKIVQEALDNGNDRTSYDIKNLELMMSQGVVEIVDHDCGGNGKSLFVLVKCLLSDEELIRHCEGCEAAGNYPTQWEMVYTDGPRYISCRNCPSTYKVAYCSRQCQQCISCFHR
jgi:hypothetical protein